MRALIIAATLVASGAAAAQEQSDTHDQTGDFSGTYLCVAEAIGGLRYSEEDKKWHGTAFNHEDDRIIVKATDLGNSTFSHMGKEVTSHGYGIEVRQPGTDRVTQCLSVLPIVQDRRVIRLSDDGVAACRAAFQEVVVNLSDLRYLTVYAFGYVDGPDDTKNTPSITAGLCTRID